MNFIWKWSSIYGNYIPLFYFCLLKAWKYKTSISWKPRSAVHDSSTLKQAGHPGEHS